MGRSSYPLAFFCIFLLAKHRVLREFKVRFQGSVFLSTYLVFQGYGSYGSLLSQGLEGPFVIVSEKTVREPMDS